MGLYSNKANVIAQDSDPGAVGAGAMWIDTSTDTVYFRNSSNDGWYQARRTVAEMMVYS